MTNDAPKCPGCLTTTLGCGRKICQVCCRADSERGKEREL
jgi:hypothetical protein